MSCIGLAAGGERARIAYIARGIDNANHARLAMVVLVLRAIERDGIGALDSHRECWLTGGLSCSANQESRIESTIGLASSAGASTSRSDGMILRNSARAE